MERAEGSSPKKLRGPTLFGPLFHHRRFPPSRISLLLGVLFGVFSGELTGEIHGFLATPIPGSIALGGTGQRPKVVLPENVRKMLRHRMARTEGRENR
jgi:hypothetical protein